MLKELVERVPKGNLFAASAHPDEVQKKLEQFVATDLVADGNKDLSDMLVRLSACAGCKKMLTTHLLQVEKLKKVQNKPQAPPLPHSNVSVRPPTIKIKNPLKRGDHKVRNLLAQSRPHSDVLARHPR